MPIGISILEIANKVLTEISSFEAMLKEKDIIKLIFGLKVQALRQEAGLSYTQLSALTGLAISYLHNIEKGKKYPKTDKILTLATALNSDYDYLVSLEPNKKLKPVVDLLRSDFLKIFPLDTFGVSISKLIELLSQAPDKVNAFISTIVKITRNFNMQGEDFYKAALRSYQDLHDNYFEEIEQKASAFRLKNKLKDGAVPGRHKLENILSNNYGVKVNRSYLSDQPELQSLLSVYQPNNKTLYLNTDLGIEQERFLLAKELGFQVLDEHLRPLETRMLEVDSFEKLLSNFHASYFSVSLLLDEATMIDFINNMSTWKKWQGDTLLQALQKYQVTAEMFMQRMANLLPRHFSIREMFFLRFYTRQDMQKFIVTKELHLSQLHDPHANQLDEHYCRRWISIGIIRQLKSRTEPGNEREPLIGAQISRYWNTPNAYFCIAFAKPTRNNAENSTSVTLGLLMNDQLKKVFPFLTDDTDISTKDVHTTCERCPIPDCLARAVPPIFLQRQRNKNAVSKGLREMRKKFS